MHVHKTHNQHCKNQKDNSILTSFYRIVLCWSSIAEILTRQRSSKRMSTFPQIDIHNSKLSTPCSAVTGHYRNANYFWLCCGHPSMIVKQGFHWNFLFSRQFIYWIQSTNFFRGFCKLIILNQQSNTSRFSLCIGIKCINSFLQQSFINQSPWNNNQHLSHLRILLAEFSRLKEPQVF